MFIKKYQCSVEQLLLRSVSISPDADHILISAWTSGSVIISLWAGDGADKGLIYWSVFISAELICCKKRLTLLPLSIKYKRSCGALCFWNIWNLKVFSLDMKQQLTLIRSVCMCLCPSISAVDQSVVKLEHLQIRGDLFLFLTVRENKETVFTAERTEELYSTYVIINGELRENINEVAVWKQQKPFLRKNVPRGVLCC